MIIDLLSAVILTASAAIVVAVLSICLGANPATRIRVAASLGFWFAVVVALAATRVFENTVGFGVRGLGIAVAVPIAILVVIFARVQSARERLFRMPLWLLNGVQSVRVIGILFVVLYANGRLPAPFAPIAGWGDIFVGVSAPIIAWVTYKRARNTGAIVWLWNVVGLADLIVAVGLGAASSPGPLRLFYSTPDAFLMTTLPWLLIPGFLVPLLATIHIGTLIRLTTTRDSIAVEPRLAVQSIS